jgi:hypothetical protein
MRAEVRTQLSIIVPNRPGATASVCRVLAENKINIESFMLGDEQKQCVVRFLVEDPARAKKALEAAGFFVAAADVLVVEVKNRVGILYEVTNALGKAGVNIDYAYASDNPHSKCTRDAFKLSELKKGLKVIKKLEK